jgi:hypothetical protein
MPELKELYARFYPISEVLRSEYPKDTVEDYLLDDAHDELREKDPYRYRALDDSERLLTSVSVDIQKYGASTPDEVNLVVRVFEILEEGHAASQPG